MSDQPISCHLHDFIEIACLYGYQIRLKLNSGETLAGQAVTTKITADKKEYLIIKQQQTQQQVELSQIKSMQALAHNPHFDLINF